MLPPVACEWQPFHEPFAGTNLSSLLPLSSTAAHFDLISSIQAAIVSLLVRWAAQHVSGHADKYKTWYEMSWWERRNFEVDEVAQEYADELLSTDLEPAPNPKFICEPCAFFVHDIKASSLSLEAVDEAVVLPGLKDYWHNKGRISKTAFDLIDWHTVKRAMKAPPPRLQRWLTKHTVGMCGVGKFQKIWGLDPDNQCPLCSREEDHLHVPRCPAVAAQDRWNSAISEFQLWCQSSHTAPALTQFFCDVLGMIRGAPDASVKFSCFRTHGLDIQAFTQARTDQLQLGPQCLLDGLLAHGWASLQQRYFRSQGSCRSGALWASNLVQQLILIGHNMWTRRNTVFHSDENVNCQRQQEELNVKIREQFDIGSRDLLGRNRLADILQYTLADKVEWLLVITTERRRMRRSSAAQRRLMWELTHSSPSNPPVP